MGYALVVIVGFTVGYFVGTRMHAPKKVGLTFSDKLTKRTKGGLP
jgi:hypothetical protein